ncbi:MAG TPA: hypothetical protein VIY47_06285 [Ignavibacteriaceae bacterium]
MDFTLKIYKQLMKALINKGYEFVSMEKYQAKAGNKKIVILRHDVDVRPDHSYKTAVIESDLGVSGTYYFRIVKQSFSKGIISKIASLGHEIGYHYEDLALAKGDYRKAIKLFEKNFNQFAGLYDVKTICMHGSPLSKFDNRLLWQKIHYSDYGIICEPYFDIDFSKVLYLTDTGRRWDGEKVSIRDKELVTGYASLSRSFKFHSTSDIIEAAENEILPNHIMLNFHPQRWTDDPILWSKELIWQRIKNQVKRMVVKQKSKGEFEN